MKGLFFTKRPMNKKYQVRFWCDPELYEEFCAKVGEQELLIQDVFTQFIEWFIKEYK